MARLFRNVVDLPRKLKPDRMFIVTDDIPKKVVDERCWLVYIIHAPSHGELAQLGERMTGSHEVRGSIPLFSTRTFWAAILFRRLLFNWAYGATVSAGDS